MLDCFQLLHFHLGSQISSIRSIKNALREAGRFYVELSKMGAALKYLDVGGGLGVDYDGSRSTRPASMNYSMREYANDVVYTIGGVCRNEGLPMPHLISESGRALTAHHSLASQSVTLNGSQAPGRPLLDLFLQDSQTFITVRATVAVDASRPGAIVVIDGRSIRADVR